MAIYYVYRETQLPTFCVSGPGDLTCESETGHQCLGVTRHNNYSHSQLSQKQPFKYRRCTVTQLTAHFGQARRPVIFAIILYSLLPHPDLNKHNANIVGLSQNEDGSRVSREVSGQLDIMSL